MMRSGKATLCYKQEAQASTSRNMDSSIWPATGGSVVDPSPVGVHAPVELRTSAAQHIFRCNEAMRGFGGSPSGTIPSQALEGAKGGLPMVAVGGSAALSPAQRPVLEGCSID